MEKITVFTPTYNRAHTLPKLYQSLCEQTFRDFEWIVVDDGSMDETAGLLRKIEKENRLKFRYIVSENGGKHRAINRGVAMANGYLFMIVDSDDYLANAHVLSEIAGCIPFLEKNACFCAVAGNKISERGTIIGSCVPWDVLDTDFIDYRERYEIKGDRAEVIKTSVMKEFPFPEIEGEKFCPEGLVWNRMAMRYKVRYLNRPYVVCEYLPGGLSDRIKELRKESPRAFMAYYSEYSRYRVSLRSKIKSALAYWAVFFKSDGSFSETIKEMGGYIGLLPFGWILHKIGRI